jgi:hypothetical protein
MYKSILTLAGDPVNEVVNHAINKVGISSIAVGASAKVAEVSGVVEAGADITTYAAIIGIIGGTLYIVNMVLTIMISHKNLKAVPAKK